MRKVFTLFLCLLIVLCSTYAQERKVDNEGKYEGVIRIKFKSSEVQKVDALQQRIAVYKQSATMNSNQVVSTNIRNLDRMNQLFKANRMKRVFRPAGKHEAKHREFGLHLWYEIEFSSNFPVKQLVDAYAKVAEVQIAEGIQAVKMIDIPNTDENKAQPSSLPSGSNDPKFEEQWHYENTGQVDGTPGSDISLLEAWQIETGDPQVIVAIEDGGIDVDHEDLAGNMWVNAGEIPGNNIDDDNNGYVDDVNGYNFVNNKGEIYGHSHGTHVAGTVSAVNNNGIGVSGVAGGTGNNDGVRLMSCQVFTNYGSGGFAEAYTYAADNGAVISQNSWGYTNPGTYDQAVLDGIDYFIANAGGSDAPMQGGLVIFAAGNDDQDAQWYPGYYDKCLSVSGLNNQDKKSWYTNFGDWVDIAAPGGELVYSNNDPRAVLSTTLNNSYGFKQGTSMACPHVSGVAALIVSKYIGNITPDQVREKLINNTDPIDQLNPGFEGKLGIGRLNAFKALSDGGTPQVPAIPADLTATNVSQTSFTAEWEAVEGASNYDIQIREGRADWTTFNTTETNYEYTGANAGTTYNMRVRANNSAGSSDYSAITDVTTLNDGIATPDNLNASDITYHYMYINWDAVDGAESYDLSVRKVGDDWTVLTISETTYWYTHLEAETTYEFKVRANDAEGSSNYSSVVSATTLEGPQPPAVPTDLMATNITENSMTISWNGSENTVSYDLDLRKAGSAWTTLDIVASPYYYENLEAETTYEFRVRAKNNVNPSDYTEIVSATTLVGPVPPETPGNLTASNITHNSMSISWDLTFNASSYDLDLRKAGEEWMTVNLTENTYDYSNLDPESTYEFRVKAKNSIGDSEYTSIQNATTLVAPTVPAIPENLIASDVTYNSFVISWDAVLDADNYDLEIRPEGGSWQTYSTSTNSYEYTSASAATLYEFKVRANNEVGSGEFTAVQTVTTAPIPVPEVPTGLNASNIGATSFTLSWNAVEFASNYTVQIKEEGSDWETYTAASTSYAYTNASAETTYEYRVNASNENGSSEYTATKSLTTTSSGPAPEYCNAYGKYTRYEYIDLVEFADMSNPSDDDNGYGNYTGLHANVSAGNTYNLYFSQAYTNRVYPNHWTIYIDFNRNGEFEDDEMVVSGYADEDGTYYAPVQIPADAALGTVRMRVMLKHRRPVRSGCEIFNYGEVEDYTINISNTSDQLASTKMTPNALRLSDEAPKMEEFKLYPNPAHNFVNIYIPESNQSKIRISTVTGKVIRFYTVDQEENNIDISNLPAGMYFISVDNGEEVITKKLIKQ